LLINIGLPPFFRFISEIFTFSVIAHINWRYLFFILILFMLNTLYHLLLLNNIKTGLTVKQKLSGLIRSLLLILSLSLNWVLF
jgi:NADH:ubiquinone oxidoreductase subunit 4 (subunit M)